MASNNNTVKVSAKDLFTFNATLAPEVRAKTLTDATEAARIRALYLASLPAEKAEARKESEAREYEVILLVGGENPRWQSFGSTTCRRGRDGGIKATDVYMLAELAGMESGQSFRIVTQLVEVGE